MLVTKVSVITGQVHQMELPITEEEIRQWQNGTLAQVVWPHLTPAQREYLITGITEDEWDLYMKNDEEDK
jgi:hypothetical protein